MSGVNKVTLVGHMGKDPEIHHLADDVSVVRFPFATTDFIMKNGVRTEQTEWHNIVMWRGLAEAAMKTLYKGKLIYIEGKLKTRHYIDNENIKRYVTEIIADNFVLLGRASDFDENDSSKYLDHL